jgi:hypothetical protein
VVGRPDEFAFTIRRRCNTLGRVKIAHDPLDLAPEGVGSEFPLDEKAVIWGTISLLCAGSLKRSGFGIWRDVSLCFK